MRRVLAAAAVAVVCLVGCQPQPPKPPTVGMRAVADPASPGCGLSGAVKGDIDETATNKVVLQRTSGGKWVDWKWKQTSDSEEVPHLLTATPFSSGVYRISFNVPSSSATLHLRVRSAGGSVVSNGVYVNPVC